MPMLHIEQCRAAQELYIGLGVIERLTFFKADGCESVHRLCLKEQYEGSCIVEVLEIVHTCCKHG